ncbi:DUF4817 domain-containing protein [Trichonephila clavipes]|nr:DUF4817 domain-containing protein [Trichonephila clavipes]
MKFLICCESLLENESEGVDLFCSNLDSDGGIRLNENYCKGSEERKGEIDNIPVNPDIYVARVGTGWIRHNNYVPGRFAARNALGQITTATSFTKHYIKRLYAERHPVRQTPAHTMFARLHQQLCETGSFQKAARNRDRTARTELNEEIVLDMVETTPSLSTRDIANEIGISYSSVWRILDDSALHPFHYQRVQSLKECDFAPRQAFSQWYLHQRIANPFLQPPCCSQMRRDHLIGPYILPDRLTGPRYLIFLEQVLPELLDSAHVTDATRTSMWFQQDGAPAHFSISVRNHLDATCGER